MNSDAYRKFLLSNIPSAKSAAGGREVTCRCFYCPDSSNPKSAHFYISIPQSEEEPSMYDCKLCHASGIVTNKTLLEWGIYDNNVAEDLILHNRKIKVNPKNSKYFERRVYNVQNSYIQDSEVSQIKLKYINERIGTGLSYEDLKRLKIVLNLKDLLKSSNVTTLTRDPSIVDQLDINFMGFISIDNSYLNMRRICKEGLVYKSIDKRYVNYNIFNDFNTDRFYTVPTSVDMCSTDRIKIHIAEGPFDILSIYLNCRHMEPGIYTSVAGSNYLGVITYFIENYMLPYVEVHLYPDNDKYGSKRNMEWIKRYLEPLKIPMLVHRNLYEGEKDFGVPVDRIKEAIIEM